MAKVSVKAAIISNVISIALISLSCIPNLINANEALHSAITNHQNVSDTMRELQHSNGFYLTIVLVGLSNIIAGYIAALIAKHDGVLNGIVSSFLFIVVATIKFMQDPTADMAAVKYIALIIITLLLTGLGGYLRQRQRIKAV